MPNELIYTATSSTDFYYDQNGGSANTGGFQAGKWSGSSTVRGALRFDNVAIAKNANLDRAGVYFPFSTTPDSGTVRLTFTGIKESDTADFSSSPFGVRPITTTTTSSSKSFGTDENWDVDITGIVEEIVAQSGWSSGNHLGILVEDNGSDNDKNITDNFFTGTNTFLTVRVTAPNLTPTPVTVSAPTFPSTRGYGIKISESGVDVKTATDSQLLFTTDKDYPRILAEGEIDTTGGVNYQIAHGLSYTPQGIAFVRKNGYSFELPRTFGGASDPVGGGVQGYFSVDNTFLNVITNVNATVYYYIFIDTQAS